MSWLPPSPPVVAILRGVLPDEILPVATALYDAGIRIMEIPLNSPDPLKSIGRLCRTFGENCLCGAGTVLSPAEVDQIADIGGKLIVSPNTDPAVIARTKERNLVSMPGFLTPTEAFGALAAGADCLKLFPASSFGPNYLRALKSVLPKQIPLFAVGGVAVETIAAWRDAGADGFGIGGEIYRPGAAPADIGRKARSLLQALHAPSKEERSRQ